MPLRFSIERDGKVMSEELTPKPVGSHEYGDIGWLPKEADAAVVTSVEHGCLPKKPA